MSDYVHRRGDRRSEKRQTKLFADAVGWQKCNVHGEYNPYAYYTESDIEDMMLQDGCIDCPFCMVEIGGVFQP